MQFSDAVYDGNGRIRFLFDFFVASTKSMFDLGISFAAKHREFRMAGDVNSFFIQRFAQFTCAKGILYDRRS